MKKLALSALALLASAPLFAQAGYVYSPPGLATTEGQYYSYYLGRFGNAISQLCDGEVTGTKRSLNEIAVRLDYRSHTTSTAQGRAWTNVTINMCESDLATFTSTFANNRKTTQTQVFSAAVTWPTQAGYPSTSPDVWGGTGGQLKFPFTTKYTYLGTADLLSEFKFEGGTMANNATWASSTGFSYYLDSYASGLTPTGSQSSSYSYIPSTRLNNDPNATPPRTTCNDSSMTTTTGAYTYGYAYTYGQYYSNRGWANKLRMYSYSYNIGFDIPVIQAYTLGNDPVGLNVFNTGCNMLHLKGPIVLMDILKTLPQSASTSGYTGFREMFFPWIPAMGGVKLTVQAAWTDSKLNQLLLSQAAEITFPDGSPPPKRYAAHAYTLTATTANYTYATYTYNPALRYGHD